MHNRYRPFRRGAVCETLGRVGLRCYRQRPMWKRQSRWLTRVRLHFMFKILLLSAALAACAFAQETKPAEPPKEKEGDKKEEKKDE